MARPRKPEDQVRADLKAARDMLTRTRQERDDAKAEAAKLSQERDAWKAKAEEAVSTLEAQ